jgi:hypothetical protein
LADTFVVRNQTSKQRNHLDRTPKKTLGLVVAKEVQYLSGLPARTNPQGWPGFYNATASQNVPEQLGTTPVTFLDFL